MDGYLNLMSGVSEEMASSSGAFMVSWVADNWQFLLGLFGIVIIAGFIKWAIGSAFTPR